MNTYKNTVQISDLTLATIASLSFPIIDLDRSKPPRVIFIFKHSPELDMFMEQFWRKELSVEPQEFINQIKNLKNRIYFKE